jgi:glycosyltransferase involved in cell wall biosynthesis
MEESKSRRLRKASVGKIAHLQVLASNAAELIRRHGLLYFARRFLSGRWLATAFGRTLARQHSHRKGEDIIGGIDEPPGGISRNIGEISGWALAREGAIDHIKALVDGRHATNVRICQPRRDIRSNLPEAEICGFQVALSAEQISAGQASIELGFTAYTTHGKSREFASRTIRLKEPGREGSLQAAPLLGERASRRGGNRTEERHRIAIFTHDLGYGGGQLYLQELLRRLAQENVTAVVRCPKNGALRAELIRLGYEVEISPTPSLVKVGDHDQSTEVIGRWLRDQDFDCVIANTLGAFYAINAAADAGIPTIWAIHESFPLQTWCGHYTEEQPGSEFLLSRLEAALRRCSRAVFETNATRDMFLKYGSADRFIKVAYGIDNSTIDDFLRDFDRDRERSRLGISKSAKVILCMATFEPRKQQTLLAQAFGEVLARHHEACLWLVGESPSHYTLGLRRFLEKKGLDNSVRLFPVTANPYPWYARADGFALLSDLESMPRSLLEAMGFGLPVLSTRVFGGGARRLAQGDGARARRCSHRPRRAVARFEPLASRDGSSGFVPEQHARHPVGCLASGRHARAASR